MTARADDKKGRIVVCSACKHDRFHVVEHRRERWREIACVGCGAVLMRVGADR